MMRVLMGLLAVAMLILGALQIAVGIGILPGTSIGPSPEPIIVIALGLLLWNEAQKGLRKEEG